MNKKQGHVNLGRHMIGDRAPIVLFLGIGAVVTLGGCDTKSEPYYSFTSMDTCEKTLSGQCDAAYKLAEQEAKRTALKYMLEQECNRDFGANICVKDDQGVWSPRMAGFITHKDANMSFAQPFFTTLNPALILYGQAFMADGREIADLRDMDGLNLDLSRDYAKPLPTSRLEQVANIQEREDSTANGRSQSGSLVNSLLGAYILSEVIDETGDYLSERERTKRYQQCLQSGRNNCDQYRVSSGTARVGTMTTGGAGSKLETKAQKTNSTYKSTTPVKTKSKGGFGSSGRSFGGFGG
ncbi:DUF1190 domain-containing protein [Vibrio sp. WXL210]|uniref:DUF1190 domain-containing protein n=1 Tax=Vibrio sp. WXL210 TaxID=3450709 RepID=UPI003EC7DED8